MKRKVITILTVLCIVLIFAGTALYVHLSRRITRNPDQATGNTAGNLYHDGLFCEDDGYVYFANPYDNNALYCMRPDESNMKKLISTETQSINAAGDYFYYYQRGTGSGEGLGYMLPTTGIYRAPKDNPIKSTCLDRILSDTLFLLGNTLYYNTSTEADGTFLKQIGIDAKDSSTVISYAVTAVNAQGTDLCYTNTAQNLHLMAIDPATGNARELIPEDIYMPILDGDYVYGIDVHNQYMLIRYSLSDGTKTILDETRTDMLNLSDQYIYYQTSGDTPQFKRIAKDGTQMEVIADGAYHTINITSQYVYFMPFGSTIPVYKIPVNGTPEISTFDAALQAAADSIK